MRLVWQLIRFDCMHLDNLPTQEIELNGVNFLVKHTSQGFPYYAPQTSLTALPYEDQTLFDVPLDGNIPQPQSRHWFNLDGNDGRGYFCRTPGQESTNSFYYRSMFLTLDSDADIRLKSSYCVNLSMLGDNYDSYVPNYEWALDYLCGDSYLNPPILKVRGSDSSPVVDFPYVQVIFPIDLDNRCVQCEFSKDGQISETFFNEYQDAALRMLSRSDPIEVGVMQSIVKKYLGKLPEDDPERIFLDKLFWGKLNIPKTNAQLIDLMINANENPVLNKCKDVLDPKAKVFKFLDSIFAFDMPSASKVRHRRPVINNIRNR